MLMILPFFAVSPENHPKSSSFRPIPLPSKSFPNSLFVCHLTVKVKYSLCLINYAPCQEGVCGSGDITPPFLTSVLVEVSRQLQVPAALLPGEGAPGTHWIGGWVGPRADLNAMDKRKFCASTGSRTPTVKLVASRYID
jgi:hypothetical protein